MHRTHIWNPDFLGVEVDYYGRPFLTKPLDRYYELLFSPVECQFYKEWDYNGLSFSIPLIPQYEVLGGKYRLDFAHLATKTAIELDGFDSHGSADDIANDRKRQREIERLGWSFIRFGGKEVLKDTVTCVLETKNYILSKTKNH
jgi:REase_MTES_1575